MTRYATTSYSSQDCKFLLKPISIAFTKIEEKEALIQSGAAHYSETVSQESPPSTQYMSLFLKLTEKYKYRLAQETLTLSKMIEENINDDICILSLARAGSPIGVLINRALNKYSKHSSSHFSISIIRDKGIDFNALDHLIFELGIKPSSIAFVDGWTAKGVITNELKKTISQYNQSRNVNISDALYVISDIGGSADYYATTDDYTIPSALMNSTVSGLVSRSILNEKISNKDFHGCVLYNHLAPYDHSNWFIDEITACFDESDFTLKKIKKHEPYHIRQQLKKIMLDFNVSDINRIKPGIAEATRVMLRRVPDTLIIKDKDNENVSHLIQIAEEKNIEIKVIKELPISACAIIKDVKAKN